MERTMKELQNACEYLQALDKDSTWESLVDDIGNGIISYEDAVTITIDELLFIASDMENNSNIMERIGRIVAEKEQEVTTVMSLWRS